MPAKAEPVAAPAPAAKAPPAKKPTKRVAKKPAAKKAGLLEAVEADVRAARAAPAAPKLAPSAEPPKPAVRAAREPAKAPEPPKYGYESLLSDVSRAYCGYDEAYFHDRPRELASQEKAGQAARAAADAREVVASREAALRSSKDAARGGRGAAPAAEARQTCKGDEEGYVVGGAGVSHPRRDRQEDRRAAPARRGRPRAGPGLEEGARGAPWRNAGRPRGRPRR